MTLRVLGLIVVIITLPNAVRAQAVLAPTPSSSPSTLCAQGLSAIVSRPTQTTSACTVDSNHILIESGFQAESAMAASPYATQTYPNAVIRIGTTVPHLELDVTPPSAIRSAGMTFASDAAFGVKYLMSYAATFAYGVNILLTVPTGSDATASNNPNALGSSNGHGYIGNVNFQGAIGKVVGYGGTLSFNSLAFPVSPSVTARYVSFVPSLDVTFTLSGTTLFVEGYLQSHGEGPGTATHSWFDAGVTKDFGKTQYDVEFGVSNGVRPMTGMTPIRRRFVGAGVSYGF